MNISLAKLKALLLYFGNNTNTKYLGKVKLMKLFYFLDFIHLKKYGAPVTFDRYIHLEHGPIPQSIKNLIDTASDDENDSMLADVIEFERPQGTEMVKMLPKRNFTETDKKLFSETELEVLAEVCQRFGNVKTKFIEDASHNEAPWKETFPLQDIPYALAAKDSDCFVTREEIELMESLA
jgi:uncharacterized phage-associated protein